MEPTWTSDCGTVNLWLGDCLPIIEGWPESLEIVADPPFGISLKPQYGNGTRRYPDGSYRQPAKQYEPVIGDSEPFDVAILERFSKQLLWGANNYGLSGGRWLIWDKRLGICPPRSQADCEIAWHSEGGSARIFRHMWDGMVRDSERGTKREHPTQKPIAVMKWCLKFAAGELIGDPYMGTGATGIAAVAMGRKFYGCEIDPTYFEIAKRRITDELNRFPLLEGVETKPTQSALSFPGDSDE